MYLTINTLANTFIIIYEPVTPVRRALRLFNNRFVFVLNAHRLHYSPSPLDG